MENLSIFGDLTDLYLFRLGGVETHFPIEEGNKIDEDNGRKAELAVAVVAE